jgi:hypothetical protein
VYVHLRLGTLTLGAALSLLQDSIIPTTSIFYAIWHI